MPPPGSAPDLRRILLDILSASPDGAPPDLPALYDEFGRQQLRLLALELPRVTARIELTEGQLVLLVKVFTALENDSPGTWGSTSQVYHLIRRLQTVAGQRAEETIDWCLANAHNRFIPFGGWCDKSITTYAQYCAWKTASAARALQLEAGRQATAEALRRTRAVHHAHRLARQKERLVERAALVSKLAALSYKDRLAIIAASSDNPIYFYPEPLVVGGDVAELSVTIKRALLSRLAKAPTRGWRSFRKALEASLRAETRFDGDR